MGLMLNLATKRFSGCLLGIALIAIASGCATSSQGPRTLSRSEKIEGLMKIAAAAVTEGDTVSAIETLNQLKSLDDSLPREYYLYALAYLNKNELSLAETAARKALSLDPTYSAAKNALGKILLDEGKLAESEKHLKEAANDILYREAALSMTNLGILYFKRMDYKNSATWLNKAIRENGALTCVAQYYLGRILLEQNDSKQAYRNLQLASKGSCSSMSEIHHFLGQALIREKKYDQARAKFVEIQRLFPDSDAYDKASEFLRGIP